MSYGKITAKQKEVLDYIKAEVRDHGYPPSVRDICKAVNLRSTSSVHAHLNSLEKNGYIRRDPTKPRAIEILDEEFKTSACINVPLVGTVAAGQPLLAVERIEQYYPLPSSELPNQNVFMLEVKGESMINAGIFNGDKVIVQQQNVADDGDMVVALIDDSATVKTYYRENGYYRLQPENDEMDPILVKANQLNILGKVIGVVRFFH